MSQIFDKSGGYRRLHSFNLATIVHLGTISFCKRFINWKDDPLGKTLDQMIGASRSGKQNIIEGSERAKTSIGSTCCARSGSSIPGLSIRMRTWSPMR